MVIHHVVSRAIRILRVLVGGARKGKGGEGEKYVLVYLYSLAGHTYFASARRGRAQGKGGRGKNTYGVSVQVFVR